MTLFLNRNVQIRVYKRLQAFLERDASDGAYFLDTSREVFVLNDLGNLNATRVLSDTTYYRVQQIMHMLKRC